MRQFGSEKSLKNKLMQAEHIAIPASLPNGLKKGKWGGSKQEGNRQIISP